jgi:hypothetical protein
MKLSITRDIVFYAFIYDRPGFYNIRVYSFRHWQTCIIFPGFFLRGTSCVCSFFSCTLLFKCFVPPVSDVRNWRSMKDDFVFVFLPTTPLWETSCYILFGNPFDHFLKLVFEICISQQKSRAASVRGPFVSFIIYLYNASFRETCRYTSWTPCAKYVKSNV